MAHVAATSRYGVGASCRVRRAGRVAAEVGRSRGAGLLEPRRDRCQLCLCLSESCPRREPADYPKPAAPAPTRLVGIGDKRAPEVDVRSEDPNRACLELAGHDPDDRCRTRRSPERRARPGLYHRRTADARGRSSRWRGGDCRGRSPHPECSAMQRANPEHVEKTGRDPRNGDALWLGPASEIHVAVREYPGAGKPEKDFARSRQSLKSGYEESSSFSPWSARVVQTMARRSGSRTGSGFRNTTLMIENIAVFAPIPSPSVRSPTTARTGRRRSDRAAWRRRRVTSSSAVVLLRGTPAEGVRCSNKAR